MYFVWCCLEGGGAHEFAAGLATQRFPDREKDTGCISCPLLALTLPKPPAVSRSEAANKGENVHCLQLCHGAEGEREDLRAGKPSLCHLSGFWKVISCCVSLFPPVSSWLSSVPPQTPASSITAGFISPQLQMFFLLGCGDRAGAPGMCCCCGAFLRLHEAGFPLGKAHVANVTDLAPDELWDTKRVLSLV